MLIDFMFYTYNAAVTTSDIYDHRMFRSGGAGSNISRAVLLPGGDLVSNFEIKTLN